MPQGREGGEEYEVREGGKPRNEPWQIHNYARAAAALAGVEVESGEGEGEKERNSRGRRDRLGNGPRKLGAIRDARTDAAVKSESTAHTSYCDTSDIYELEKLSMVCGIAKGTDSDSILWPPYAAALKVSNYSTPRRSR